MRDLDAAETRIYLEFEYRRVQCPRCNSVKQETLAWLASSSRFTQRYEDRIGQQCREMSIKRVAEFNRLSWDQVRRMEMSYMRRLIERTPLPETITAAGVDEISVKRGHEYRIVVASLDDRRPLWLGGEGRTEEEMKLFFNQKLTTNDAFTLFIFLRRILKIPGQGCLRWWFRRLSRQARQAPVSSQGL